MDRKNLICFRWRPNLFSPAEASLLHKYSRTASFVPKAQPSTSRVQIPPLSSRPDLRAWADDGDADGGPDDYDMDEDEMEEVDNKKDFDIDYDTAVALATAASGRGGDEDIAMVHSKSFVFTQDWDSQKNVDYRINEDDFHKIGLLDCDFFIRKPPDLDNDVYDFREAFGAEDMREGLFLPPRRGERRRGRFLSTIRQQLLR